MKLGAVILTGDFTKGAERELASSAPTDQCRISPLEAAFSCANVSWPTAGVTPLWGSSGEPHGCIVSRMFRFGHAPRIEKKTVADYAPRVNQCRPGVHWVEDHGPNLACRAMAPRPVCGPQTQEGRVAGRLDIPAEV